MYALMQSSILRVILQPRATAMTMSVPMEGVCLRAIGVMTMMTAETTATKKAAVCSVFSPKGEKGAHPFLPCSRSTG